MIGGSAARPEEMVKAIPPIIITFAVIMLNYEVRFPQDVPSSPHVRRGRDPDRGEAALPTSATMGTLLRGCRGCPPWINGVQPPPTRGQKGIGHGRAKRGA